MEIIFVLFCFVFSSFSFLGVSGESEEESWNQDDSKLFSFAGAGDTRYDEYVCFFANSIQNSFPSMPKLDSVLEHIKPRGLTES